MTALAVAGVVLLVMAILLGYIVVTLIVMVTRAVLRNSTGCPTTSPAPHDGNPPTWSALDDQQLARYLKQSPP